jgi:hypothetical protein
MFDTAIHFYITYVWYSYTPLRNICLIQLYTCTQHKFDTVIHLYVTYVWYCYTLAPNICLIVIHLYVTYFSEIQLCLFVLKIQNKTTWKFSLQKYMHACDCQGVTFAFLITCLVTVLLLKLEVYWLFLTVY